MRPIDCAPVPDLHVPTARLEHGTCLGGNGVVHSGV